MKCVKCGVELAGSELECPSCGVIVSKARAVPPPRPPSESLENSTRPGANRKYHYLVVPFHGQIRAGQGIGEVSSQLQDLINHYAGYGWEFVQIGRVSLTINQGCLAGLLGSGSSQHSYDQVVFRQSVAHEGTSA